MVVVTRSSATHSRQSTFLASRVTRRMLARSRYCPYDLHRSVRLGASAGIIPALAKDVRQRRQSTLTASTNTNMSATSIPVITRDMLVRAHAEMERRLRAAEAADDVDAEVEDVVVAASGVTPHQLRQIPSEWCRDVRLEILGDGALVVTCTESRQHRKACGEVFGQVRDYAGENHQLSLNEDSEFGFDLGASGFCIPDVSLLRTMETHQTPLVLIEVEVRHRSLRKMVETAARYFRHLPRLRRVVLVKFYQCRKSALDRGLVQVPAMALVFARARPTDIHQSRVRIIAAESFGNTPIPSMIVDGLASAHSFLGRSLPMVSFPEARDVLDRVGFEGNHVRLPHVVADLAGLRPRVAIPFTVPMDDPYPDIPFELFGIFRCALLGWVQDRMAA